MKRLSQHAFEPEEVMAYLDGELPANEAAELASHLEHCAECQAVAAQIRQVSERTLDFQVEPCPAKVAESVLKAADEKQSEQAAKPIFEWRPRRRRTLRVLAWAGGLAVVLLIAAVFVVPNTFEEKRAAVAPPAPPLASSTPIDESSRLQKYESRPGGVVPEPAPGPPMSALARIAPGVVARGAQTMNGPMAGRGAGPVQLETKAGNASNVIQGPMIVQTASITILASNYDQASEAIQRITRQHGGYVQELNASTPTGAARSLSATLRVPEKQLDACLANLRKLGHVEQEWRNNQEITDQYIDLTARLKNARAEEQRIIQLLQTRTGKLSDVLEAERELARVRGEIESMAGQRTYMEHQVSYATVQLQLNEEYRAQLNSGAVSTGTRIRNSLVEGFRNLGDGVVGMLLFVFAYGPSILFWLALIGVPAWLGWRRWRRRRAAN
jgi:anti-sigma factor RsiW